MQKRKIIRVISLLSFVLLLGSEMAPPAFAGTSGTVGLGQQAYPASGFQIAVAVIVAVVLIVGGVALRRWSRSQRP